VFGGRGFTFEFVSQRWKGSFFNVFVYGASFVVCWMVTIAEDAFDMFRFFCTCAKFGAVIACAFNTPGAVEAIPVSLTFTALQYISFGLWRLKLYLTVI
jgi:hypothetical protein